MCSGRGCRANRNDGGRILHYIRRMTRVTLRIQREPFDAAAETAAVARGRTDIGAVVSFTGICRGDEAGEPIAALTLEHYPGMAEGQIGRIAREAVARWPLLALTVIHRVGRIAVGDDIVLVVAAATHRQAAFEAAGFVMDFLKSEAPFWKKQHLTDGTNGGWVEAKESDAGMLGRWKRV